MKKAVFLDRDGTINEDVGHLYENDRLVLIPGAIEAMRLFQEHFQLFIITSQSGIGKNIFTLDQYREFNSYFQSVLKENGIDIKETYCCPHRKDEGCACYKPGTLFMEQARQDHGISLENSYVLGDRPHDVEMGLRMGAKAIYLLSGHGRKHISELEVEPDLICGNIYEAAIRPPGMRTSA